MTSFAQKEEMDSKIASNLLPRLQRILDRLLELFRVRLDVGTEAGDQLTVRADQELIEVPADGSGMAVENAVVAPVERALRALEAGRIDLARDELTALLRALRPGRA